MVMGIVEDERCFSNLGLMKNNFRNILTTHLDLAIKMFTQTFFIFDTFQFVIVMNVWNVAKSHHIVTRHSSFVVTNV